MAVMADCKPKDIYITLMGLTGAGKSSFINHCIKHEVVVGDGLQECTGTVEVFSFEYRPGVTIHLVDTPGFDDTNRQDSAVLRDISAWLSKSYTEKILLNGILYLHRISDPRMQGSGKLSISLLRKLCGKDAFKNVVLVTTMWELVEKDIGDRREKEPEETEEFWDSARNILSMFVPEEPEVQPEMVTLAIQKELADDNKTLDQTSAGQLLDGTWAKEKEALQRELEEVRDAVKSANEERDHMMAKLLQEQQDEMNAIVEKMREEQDKLRMLDEQIEVSRTLSKDLEDKARLQDEDREKRQVVTVHQKEKLEEQETTLLLLQKQLSETDLSTFQSRSRPYFSAPMERLFSLGPKEKRYGFTGITSYNGDTVDHLVRSDDDLHLVADCGNQIFRFTFSVSDDKFILEHQEDWSTLVDQSKRSPVKRIIALSSDSKYLITATVGSWYYTIWMSNTGTKKPITFLRSRDNGSLFEKSPNEITCIEFGTGGNFAVAFGGGRVCFYEIIDSAGSIEYCGQFESSGEVLSLACISGMRTLVGTDKGLFIGTSAGTVDRMGSQILEMDHECGFGPIDDTTGVYWRAGGQIQDCEVQGDQIIPTMTVRPAVSSNVTTDVLLACTMEIERLAVLAKDGCVGIVTFAVTVKQ
ncbi:unnamed protein product [Fusarium graminearum]|uniref:Chromosome 2, complete genome n=1 Tax=Gibberella zeae (strain ATCC MYA-4620 / CBS 123657 / FGSC 9075 / NRRL 31084 / PH-1) TaxID=229533 RepID=A0A098DDJ5_GIBZE|nr:unnamed protein product [Fusarium graminearum]CZS79793.1 unnamed protein product [Fusarium graminearum]